MTTYNTRNPLGSSDPKDLFDNAENLDRAVNGDEATFRDRLGKNRKTYKGMELDYLNSQESRQDRFNSFIANSGYQYVGDYSPGITITEYNQVVRDASGEFWRLSGSIDLPYTTTGLGLPENFSFTPAGDAVLRQELEGGTAKIGGSNAYVVGSRNITPATFGIVPSKTSATQIYNKIVEGVEFAIPNILTTFEDVAALWFAGERAPIAFFGDSTTDGAGTTINGTTPATVWNRDKMSGGNVPDGFSYDHDDSSVPNAYPNILQRMAREYFKNDTIRCYNAGYRGQQLQNGWAARNIHNAIYANPRYKDCVMVGINFGLNDVAANGNITNLLENTYAYTKALILDAYERGKQPFLMTSTLSGRAGPQTYNNYNVSSSVDRVKERLAKEFGIELIDMSKFLLDLIYNNGDLWTYHTITADDLHLNDLGHLKQAEFLLKTISGNLIPKTSDLRAIDLTHPACRITLSGSALSSAFGHNRGANEQYRTLTLNATNAQRAKGSDIFDLWLWCDEKDVSPVFMHAFGMADRGRSTDTSTLPQYFIESLLFSAEDYHTDSLSFPYLGVRGVGNYFRPDTPVYTKKLKYGLNRIRCYAPNTLTPASWSSSKVLPWIDLVRNAQENRRPVLSYSSVVNQGVNLSDIGAWRKVISSENTPRSNNIERALKPYDPHLGNRYSTLLPGDWVEWRVNADWKPSNAVILGYALYENREMETSMDVKKSTYLAGPCLGLAATPSGSLTVFTSAPNNNMFFIIESYTPYDILKNKDVLLKMTLIDIDSVRFEMKDESNTLINEFVVTSSDNLPKGGILSYLTCGISGGTMVFRHDQTESMLVNDLSIRQNIRI